MLFLKFIFLVAARVDKNNLFADADKLLSFISLGTIFTWKPSTLFTSRQASMCILSVSTQALISGISSSREPAIPKHHVALAASPAVCIPTVT